MQKNSRLTQEEFNRLRILTNFVAIRPYEGNDEIEMPSGVKLYIDTTFEPQKHAGVVGEVMKVPEKLVFQPGKGMGTLQYDTDMELKVGDKAFYHYLVPENCIEASRFLEVEDEVYLLVPYDEIFLAERGEEVIMTNGWILAEPILENAFESSLIMRPESSTNIPSPREATVAFVGQAVRKYLHDKTINETESQVEPGDKIAYMPNSDIPLEYDLHASFRGKKVFYRMQRKDILGILETV